MITIANERLRADILPEFGGGLARLDVIEGSAPIPVLRPWSGDAANPVDRACFVMLPWCNRVSGNGFVWAGRRHDLPQTVPDQTMPIHGLALTQPWTLSSVGPQSACLTLSDKTCAPFDFSAQLRYRLAGDGLFMSLRITHHGPEPVPYGIGFHPWYSAGPRTQLRFDARAFVLEDEHRLPTEVVSIPDPRAPKFCAASPVPPSLFNGTFLDWTGPAILSDTPAGTITTRAKGATRHLHVFSRGRDQGFVCLEPVSHSVDSFNRAMAAADAAVLGTNAALAAVCMISVRR